MNASGLLQVVRDDLVHAKHWKDVSCQGDTVKGTSPEYGTTVVYVCSYRNSRVSLSDPEKQQHALLAIVDEDSTVSYFRIAQGIASDLVPPSKKDFKKKLR